MSNQKQEFDEVSRAFGKVEQKLDETFNLLKQHVSATEDKSTLFSKRLDELEAWQASINQKIVWITSAFAVFFYGLVSAAKMLYAYFSTNFSGPH